MTQEFLGPLLILDTVSNGAMHLAALFVAPDDVAVPAVQGPEGEAPQRKLLSLDGWSVYRARFRCPADRPSAYRWNGEDYALAGALDGDMRIAFASCNGEEHGDLERDPEERNLMWARLCEQHRRAPFSLLLHGGDQIYADEATRGHPLSDQWPKEIPRDPARADLLDLRQHLRRRFFARYRALLEDRQFAWLCARVPALAQWDDHDICDGWGSLQRSRTHSAVGQTLFDVAREMTLLFQHGTVDGDLPARFHDPGGQHLGWSVELPGLRLVAPDLRSERSRREVMGQGGWRMMQQVADRPADGHTFLISSVPLLGPRLSILEFLMVLIPQMQKYEDDLRDQWQSRAHRESWRRMLRLVRQMAGEGGSITALSGEIHLATRATMALDGDRVLHQLVASGIAHRAPPQIWARTLGALATLGESPLPGHPIAIHRIPGQSNRYVAERNALILTRRDSRWQACWDFEHAGVSPPLDL